MKINDLEDLHLLCSRLHAMDEEYKRKDVVQVTIIAIKYMVYLSLMSYDDMLILFRRQGFQLILIQTWSPIGCEKPLVLCHTQWLPFLTRRSSILWHKVPE